MNSEHVVTINDPKSEDGYTQLRVGDKIALQSMPLRPFKIARIFAGGDNAKAAGEFPKGGVIMLSARQLASAFLVKRYEKGVALLGRPGVTCTHAAFKTWYDGLGGRPHCLAQSYSDHGRGCDIQSPAYLRSCADAGIDAPFDKDASPKQGAQPVAVNENVLRDDPYPTADCTQLELAVWLGRNWGMKLTAEMELYHREGWQVHTDEFREMLEHVYDDMEDGGTEAA